MMNNCNTCKHKQNQCSKLREEIEKSLDINKDDNQYIMKYIEKSRNLSNYFSCENFVSNTSFIHTMLEGIQHTETIEHYDDNLIGKEILIESKYKGFIVGILPKKICRRIDENNKLIIETIKDLFAINIDKNAFELVSEIDYKIVE